MLMMMLMMISGWWVSCMCGGGKHCQSLLLLHWTLAFLVLPVSHTRQKQMHMLCHVGVVINMNTVHQGKWPPCSTYLRIWPSGTFNTCDLLSLTNNGSIIVQHIIIYCTTLHDMFRLMKLYSSPMIFCWPCGLLVLRFFHLLMSSSITADSLHKLPATIRLPVDVGKVGWITAHSICFLHMYIRICICIYS